MSSNDEPNQTEERYIEEWIKKNDAVHQADEKVQTKIPNAQTCGKGTSSSNRPRRNKQKPKYLKDFL